MQLHRSSSVMGKSTAEVKSSGAADGERQPMFHTVEKSSASKSSEELLEGALTPSRHQQNYGATTTLHSLGPPELDDCQGHGNIHGVFQVEHYAALVGSFSFYLALLVISTFCILGNNK